MPTPDSHPIRIQEVILENGKKPIAVFVRPPKESEANLAGI